MNLAFSKGFQLNKTIEKGPRLQSGRSNYFVASTGSSICQIHPEGVWTSL